MAGYYRKFIKDFAKISAPLTRLTKKNMTISWSIDCEEAFQRLKKALTTAPVLTLPDGNKVFTVYTEMWCRAWCGLDARGKGSMLRW